MKERLIGLIKTYILFVCIFILQKPLFILYYSSLYAGTSWTDPFLVIWNGLPLDLSLAGYLTAIPDYFLLRPPGHFPRRSAVSGMVIISSLLFYSLSFSLLI
mgnify:CR=1 FL=1